MDTSKLYEAVGHALSGWELLECHLGWVFAALCGDVTNEAPARAYGVVASSGGRIEMLREAFACYEHRADPAFSGFSKLLDRIRDFGARRNEIAHGLVMGFEQQEGGVQVSKGAYLCAAMYNSRKTDSLATMGEKLRRGEVAGPGWMAGRYAYTSGQIDHYREQFRLLREEVMQIHGKLMALRYSNVSKEAEGDGKSG